MLIGSVTGMHAYNMYEAVLTDTIHDFCKHFHNKTCDDKKLTDTNSAVWTINLPLDLSAIMKRFTSTALSYASHVTN